MKRYLTLLFLCCFEAAAEPLSLETVLDSSATFSPKILEALAKQQGAEGVLLSNEGSFDLMLSSEGYDRVSGFWSGRFLDTKVKQPLQPLGAEIYGGYRVSDGRFPIYEDQFFTNTGGEFKIGTLFSLLRDRSIDKRRFALRDAELEIARANLELLLTKIAVQHKAILAYWKWVTSGRVVRVYEELLTLALEREKGLIESVRSGAKPRIFLTENRQNILKRERFLAQSRQKFLTSANELSFFYRDSSGEPKAPENIPPIVRMKQADVTALSQGAKDALEARPELQILERAFQQAENKLLLAENNLLPRFDFSTELSTDVGDVAEGGQSRDSTDAIVAFTFSVPLQRRTAKGQKVETEAKMRAIKREQQRAEEQIAIQIQNFIIDLRTTQELVRIAEREVKQTIALQDAEYKRFDSGASDFFLVNIREETSANAKIALKLAELQARIARANFDAATVDLDRLGLR